MIKLNFKNLLFFTTLLAYLSSCEPVVVPDPIDPRLPKYTETGDNAAGAVVNDAIWESTAYQGWFTSNEQSYIYAFTNDSLVFEFWGSVDGASVFLSFHLMEQSVFTFDGLIQLKNKKFILGGNPYFGQLSEYSSAFGDFVSLKSTEGQLYIKHVTLTESKRTAIISGTFGFIVKDNNGFPVHVSYGRFDYKIKESENFRAINPFDWNKK